MTNKLSIQTYKDLGATKILEKIDGEWIINNYEENKSKPVPN